MKINNRLKQIGDLVDTNSFCLDIGCDHALLDIYLVKKDKNITAIASDIAEGPLNSARENIKREKLEDKMDDNSSVKKASVNLEGRLFNIILTTKKGTKLDDMKDYCVKLLELYSEEELKYYDIQFYLVNEDKKAESYPAIGYHNKKATKISWSN